MSIHGDLPKDHDRHREALLITDPGASNPSGVALALHNACRQVLAEGGSQRTDPAVRLMCNQLVFLLEGTEVIGLEEYRKLTAHCRANARQNTAAA